MVYKRYDGCIIRVLFQISCQLQTQIVKNRIVCDYLLGNKLLILNMLNTFGKVRHNSRNESSLRCTLGALQVVVRTKKLHFVCRKRRKENKFFSM